MTAAPKTKKRQRKKLTKVLTKLVKRHGSEAAMALVAGIVAKLVADRRTRASRKAAGRSTTAPRAASQPTRVRAK